MERSCPCSEGRPVRVDQDHCSPAPCASLGAAPTRCSAQHLLLPPRRQGPAQGRCSPGLDRTGQISHLFMSEHFSAGREITGLEELTSVPARGKHRISPSSHRITAGKARITSHATSPFAHPCVNLVAGEIKNNIYIIGINWHRNAEGKGELHYSGAVQHRSGCPQRCHCPLLVKIFLRKKGWIWLILEDTL